MRRLLRKRPALGMALLSTAATAVGIAISLAIDWFPEPASTASKDIDTLWDVLLIASVPVFVLVMSVALYSVFAWRVKPGDERDGAPIHGNTKLEVIWVTIPFVMVTALALYGWVVLNDIESKEKNPLIVNVTGQQFAWSFEYPSLQKVKSNQLVLPMDQRVEFRVKTKDVIHSFWVPQFRLKTDTVPGLTTRIRVTPNRLGRYDVVCAELCGIGHATMRQAVRVVPPAEFETWVSERQARAADGGVAKAGGDTAAAGKSVFTDSGCAGCHTMAGTGSDTSRGPSVAKLTRNAARFGKREDQSVEEYVRTSIEEPDSFVVPGFQKGVMPGSFKDNLSGAEISTLVKYLLDVGGEKTK